MDGLTRVLYDVKTIDGTPVTIYQCGNPPEIDYGEGVAEAMERFESPSSTNNGFYEAFAEGRGFHRSKTPPSEEELRYHLRNAPPPWWERAKALAWIIGFVILVTYCSRSSH